MKQVVSAIVAAYNEERYIGRCIESLLKQSYQPLEIIVVDDGSKDKTREIIKKYPGVSCFETQHQGTAIARNFGVSQSRGKIAIFVDADMEFKKNFIDMLTLPIREGRAKGTFSKLEYVANWDRPFARCWNINSNPNLPDRLRVLQNKDKGEDFRAILKSEFEKVKGFDNIGYTDTWTLAKKLNYRPVNAPEAVYYHHNPDNIGEIFRSACWIGKRNYKMGIVGSLITLVRSFILLSIIKGTIRSIKYQGLPFITFQVVYDFGLSVGVIQKILLNRVSK
ncbi:glycosyltransferase family 2 protein [Candidatus Roizmanbacteria bacterium]|nr:glycosyltransferase family 2 protein [Candidatus Roizmanbacteria bacterium]